MVGAAAGSRITPGRHRGHLALTTKEANPVYLLSASLVKNAVTVVSDQMLKAGYRLAAVLNASLAR
jgi:hypothetical protein